MRILIADDNPGIRQSIGGLLADSSWEICGEASDGIEALAEARRLVPDLVLLDVSMPGANGMHIAEVLRRELPQTKILMLSHHDLQQILPDAQKKLADGFIDKMHMATDLNPAVSRLFAKTQSA